MNAQVKEFEKPQQVEPRESIGLCRACGCAVNANTFAANGGFCNAHAARDRQWRDSDDYRP